MTVRRDLAGRRILVVDDDAAFTDYASSLLRLYGADHVEVARGGVEALEIISRAPLDAVVTDHRMPGPTGVQLLAMVRTAGYTRPFVIVTAFPGDEVLRSVSRLERASVIAKPFEPSALVGAVADSMSVAAH